MDEPILRRLAKRVLGNEIAKRLWKRIEVIGDIAILRKPFDVDIEVFKPIAEALLKELKYVKSVWLAASPVHGDYRIREYIHLAGEYRSETIYREHGCTFMLDIRKVYISPVLSYDHIRVAQMVKEGERILNMFAGIGGYSIVISKHAKPSYVLSIDINEHAVMYLKRNVVLNKVEVVNDVIHGDAFLVTQSLSDESFDRVLIPLPELALKAFRLALRIVRNSGIVHVHLFVESQHKKNAIAEAMRKLTQEPLAGVEIRLYGGHVIRSIGPRKYHVVLDIEVLKHTS